MSCCECCKCCKCGCGCGSRYCSICMSREVDKNLEKFESMDIEKKVQVLKLLLTKIEDNLRSMEENKDGSVIINMHNMTAFYRLCDNIKYMRDFLLSRI